MSVRGISKSRVLMVGTGMAAVVLLVLVSIQAISRPEARSQADDAALEAEGFPVTIETADGFVAIDTEPQRIVSQTVMTDEVLLAILPESRLVGVHPLTFDPRYSNIVEQATARGWDEKVVQRAEEIIAATPDLVFMATYSQPEVVQQVRQISAADVIRLGEFNRLVDLRANVLKVGQAVGEVQAARELVATMDGRIEAAQAAVPEGAPSPRVMSYNLAGHTAGKGTLFDDIVRTIGGVNVAAEHGVSWFGQVAAASVAAWNPEVIIAGAPPGQENSMRSQMLADPVLAATEAGKRGRIIVLPDPLYLAVSHHVADLVAVMVEQVYDVEVPGEPVGSLAWTEGQESAAASATSEAP